MYYIHKKIHNIKFFSRGHMNNFEVGPKIQEI